MPPCFLRGERKLQQGLFVDKRERQPSPLGLAHAGFLQIFVDRLGEPVHRRVHGGPLELGPGHGQMAAASQLFQDQLHVDLPQLRPEMLMAPSRSASTKDAWIPLMEISSSAAWAAIRGE